ncbi:MAG: metallophosphoesterase [Aquabacterium sp.]|jgi:predicted MPP superfamily phosphohydrolase|nr:MAG: metallophosphoesterase [Aquabacterium sp.]
MRRHFLYLFSLAVHGYVAWRLLPPLAGAWPWAAGAIGALLLLSAALVPMALIAQLRRARKSDEALSWAGLVFMGMFSSFFVLTFLRDIALGLLGLASSAWPALAAGGMPALVSAALIPPLAIAATVLGFLNARRTAAVKRVDVPIAGLPPALHGFSIAQITDIHVGPTIKGPYLQAIVDKVNGLQADMVAVTGDLVDGSVAELAPHVAPLAQLTSRHGTFFVTGNHDYYSGAHAWIAELQRLGLRVLLNEHEVLRHGGAALVVAGVADASAHHFDPTHRSDPHRAVAGAPADAAVRLLLAHQPLAAIAAADAGYDLQISGHTHGGQFWPWNFFVPLQQPFTAGLHRLKKLWVYTSRGTGYWGPPKRFGAPSEITHIKLVPAAG